MYMKIVANVRIKHLRFTHCDFRKYLFKQNKNRKNRANFVLLCLNLTEYIF